MKPRSGRGSCSRAARVRRARVPPRDDADVVRESGLSVGAIYTYFKSKDELFLAGCDLERRSLGELAGRLAGEHTTGEKLAIGVGYFFDSIDAFGELPEWARSSSRPGRRPAASPPCARCSVRRREQLVTVGQMLLREGIARGDLPRWIDVEARAAYMAMLDGLILLRVEEGGAYRRAEAERRAPLLQLLLAAASVAEPPPSRRQPRARRRPTYRRARARDSTRQISRPG